MHLTPSPFRHDQVLDLLRQNVPKLIATLPLPNQPTFVSTAISTARQHGIDSIFKFSLYAAISLSQGQMRMAGPQGTRLLEELKRDGTDLLDRLETFDLDDA